MTVSDPGSTNRWRRSALLCGWILGLVLFDRWLKLVSIEHLTGREPIDLLWGFARLVYQENQGGMLSMGAGLPESIRFLFFTALVAILLGALLVAVLVKRSVRTTEAIAAALVIGGGAGNVIDRLIYNGVVIDYITIGVGSLRTGVFNLADFAILAGAALYVLGRRPVASVG